MTALAPPRFPVLCFTRNLDVTPVTSASELGVCGPRTLREEKLLGMDIVDASGDSWRVSAISQVGYAPFSWRWLNPFLPRLRRIEYALEPGPKYSLHEVQERVLACIDAHPEYWREVSYDDADLIERKAAVRSTKAIADLHDVLGSDIFGD